MKTSWAMRISVVAALAIETKSGRRFSSPPQLDHQNEFEVTWANVVGQDYGNSNAIQRLRQNRPRWRVLVDVNDNCGLAIGLAESNPRTDNAGCEHEVCAMQLEHCRSSIRGLLWKYLH